MKSRALVLLLALVLLCCLPAQALTQIGTFRSAADGAPSDLGVGLIPKDDPPEPYGWAWLGNIQKGGVSELLENITMDTLSSNIVGFLQEYATGSIGWFVVPVVLLFILLFMCFLYPCVLCCCRGCNCWCFVKDEDRKEYSILERVIPVVIIFIVGIFAFIMLVAAADSFRYISHSGFDSLQNQVVQLVPKIEKTANSIFTGAKDAITDAFDGIEGVITSAVDASKTGVEPLNQPIDQLITELGTLQTRLNTVQTTIEEKASYTIPGDLQSNTQRIGETIILVNSIKTDYLENIDELFNMGMLTNQLTNVRDQIADTIDGAQSGMGDTFKDMGGTIDNVFESFETEGRQYMKLTVIITVLVCLLLIPMILVAVGFFCKRTKCSIIASFLATWLLFFIFIVGLLTYLLGMPLNQMCGLLESDVRLKVLDFSAGPVNPVDLLYSCREDPKTSIINFALEIADVGFDMESCDTLLDMFDLQGLRATLDQQLSGALNFDNAHENLEALNMINPGDIAQSAVCSAGPSNFCGDNDQIHNAILSLCDANGLNSPSTGCDGTEVKYKCVQNAYDPANPLATAHAIGFYCDLGSMDAEWPALRTAKNELYNLSTDFADIQTKMDAAMIQAQTVVTALNTLTTTATTTLTTVVNNVFNHLTSDEDGVCEVFDNLLEDTNNLVKCSTLFNIIDPPLLQLCGAYFPAIGATGVSVMGLTIFMLIFLLLSCCCTHRFKKPGDEDNDSNEGDKSKVPGGGSIGVVSTRVQADSSSSSSEKRERKHKHKHRHGHKDKGVEMNVLPPDSPAYVTGVNVNANIYSEANPTPVSIPSAPSGSLSMYYTDIHNANGPIALTVVPVNNAHSQSSSSDSSESAEVRAAKVNVAPLYPKLEFGAHQVEQGISENHFDDSSSDSNARKYTELGTIAVGSQSGAYSATTSSSSASDSEPEQDPVVVETAANEQNFVDEERESESENEQEEQIEQDEQVFVPVPVPVSEPEQDPVVVETAADEEPASEVVGEPQANEVPSSEVAQESPGAEQSKSSGALSYASSLGSIASTQSRGSSSNSDDASTVDGDVN